MAEQPKIRRAKLGREIRFSSLTEATVTDTQVSILIGIGSDYTAALTMELDAWFALNAGEDIHISKVKANG